MNYEPKFKFDLMLFQLKTAMCYKRKVHSIANGLSGSWVAC